MVGQCQAWHAIMAFIQDTRSNNVGRGNAIIAFRMYTRSDDVVHDMLSSPFESTHDRTTSGMACPHGCLEAQMVRRRRALDANISLRQKTRSDDVDRGMPSSPFDGLHSKTMSVVACHNIPWEAHTVGQCRVWHPINTLGNHPRSNDIGRGILSSPYE